MTYIQSLVLAELLKLEITTYVLSDLHCQFEQGHWGELTTTIRNRSVWPTLFHLNVSTAFKTAITLAKKTVGRPSADLSADHRPIYRPIKCQISALFSSADKK